MITSSESTALTGHKRAGAVWFLPIARVVAPAIVILLSPVPGRAHDYWLAQPTHTIEVGDTCTIKLLVGDRLEPELERPLQKEITARYHWMTGGGTLDLLEAMPDSARPVFQRRIEHDGASLVVMDRDYVVVESTYDRFRDFLDHEEKAAIATQIKDVPGETEMRRRYARNLKALLRAGSGDEGSLHRRVVDQRLEILLQEDPGTLAHGDELNVQVHFDGRPVDNELVRVFIGDTDGRIAEMDARCNSRGTAGFKVENEGLWVVRVAHLRRSDSPEVADWDTYYATFSFVYP